MGRILFLSAVALVAYRYISKSNQRHQPLAPGDKKSEFEILPPAPSALPAPAAQAFRGTASESSPAGTLLVTSSSRAAEPDPVR